MGTSVGKVDGISVGWPVGGRLGTAVDAPVVGAKVGDAVPTVEAEVGVLVGMVVLGASDGAKAVGVRVLGVLVNKAVGVDVVGGAVGEAVRVAEVGGAAGEAVGDGVGSSVGPGVGERVGDGVGSGVGLHANSHHPSRAKACLQSG